MLQGDSTLLGFLFNSTQDISLWTSSEHDNLSIILCSLNGKI